MPDQVKIGVIGAGQIGKHHIGEYKDVPEANIVALCDVRADEAARVAQENGIPSTYSDYHELLKRDDITSVDVCLHNRLHAEVTIAALRAGKNVYCEKPMSWLYSEAKAMYDTAKKTQRMLHIQLNTIYEPVARAAKRIIDEGHLGRIYYAKSSWYRRHGRPWVDGYGTPAFVQRSASGGGATIDVGVYRIGRMMWLLGNPELVTVSGATYQMLENMYPERRKSGGYDVEELGLAFVRLGSGITYTFEEAWAIHSENQAADYVCGSKAGLRVDPLRFFSTLSDMEMDGTFDLERADVRWHQCDATAAGYDSSQRHWVWAQLGRVPLIDTAGIALKTAQISEGIYLSAHLGREVTADDIERATADYRTS